MYLYWMLESSYTKTATRIFTEAQISRSQQQQQQNANKIKTTFTLCILHIGAGI